ncbi:DUF4113 domain-containing protein [Methylobacterium indicum]|uniref:DUF4113 domain-containing protein n=1 Tax=Methylobacterium indicum TaxID=1775910 RepID=UPI003CC80036
MAGPAGAGAADGDCGPAQRPLRRDRVRFAAPGLGRGWKLKAEFLSQRYTTRWGELLAV